jgi:N-acetylglucosaminyl-diphospho-decaprenol L-rhamnosyltransferase
MGLLEHLHPCPPAPAAILVGATQVMRIAGIIVNYRTTDLTLRVARSLRDEMKPLAPFRLYLVDNDSGDGSVAAFQQAARAEDWHDVEVIAAPRNGGFGYGINQAVRKALELPQPPEYFYILNSDAFADPGSLQRMVDFLDAHPEAGLAGSHIHGPDGSSQVAAFRFPSLASELESSACFGLITQLLRKHVVSLPVPASDCEVEWIPGTSMLIRRSTFEKAGLFDEEFFLYFEEIDFCRSARKVGCNAYYVANAPITHIGAVSTGMGDHSRPMPSYWFASRRRYFRKHHGVAYAALCDLARFGGMLIWHAKERVAGRTGKTRPHLLRDFALDSLKHLRS